MKTPETRLCAHHLTGMSYRDVDLVEDLIGKKTFTEVMIMQILGREARPVDLRIVDAVLVTLMEHGLTPSAITTRLIYMSAPENLQGAVASGLMAVGSQFVGTMENCSRLLDRIRQAADGEAEALAIAREFRESRRPLPGFGHHLHKPDDPRSIKLLALAEASGDDSPHRRDEPYRRALIGVYARLAATAQRLTGQDLARRSTVAAPAYETPQELSADLAVIAASLAAHHGAPIGKLRLAGLQQAVEVFGFHLATVDLRQSSDVHERVLAELFARAGTQRDGKPLDYLKLDEDERVALLRAKLAQARPLASPWIAYSEDSTRELAVLRAAAAGRARYGKQAVRQTIVSHTETLSDLLEVMVLQKEAGLIAPAGQDIEPEDGLMVVPLFETIPDLQRGAAIRSAGAYLRGLTEKARAGEFSLGPILMSQGAYGWKVGTGRVLDLLETLTREHGRTLLMVTHDPTAASYAHRVLFLADGRLVGEVSRSGAIPEPTVIVRMRESGIFRRRRSAAGQSLRSALPCFSQTGVH